MQSPRVLGLVGILVSLLLHLTSSNTTTPTSDTTTLAQSSCSWKVEDKVNATTTTTTVEDGGSGKWWREGKVEFSISMLHSIYNGSNLFFSPHSIHETLLVALFGAGGVTEKELRSLLKVGDIAKGNILRDFKAEGMLRSLGCPLNGGIEVRLATKLWVDSSEILESCILEHLGDQVEQLDFINDTQSATATINSWVDKTTDGKIPDLIGGIEKGTRLAIVNAAYFRGVWEQQFKKSRTKLGLFYSSPSQVFNTHLMHLKGNFRHGASEELKAYMLELPYEGDSVSMLIILPPFTPSGLEVTLAALNGGSLIRGMEDLVADSIEVVLPRFKLSSTLQLTSSLEQLGLGSLFNSATANLSDLSSGGNLWVDEAIHKASLDVDEEGATAAAGTALIGTRSGRPLQQNRFVANHPFIFGVWDKCRETLLFLGVLHRP